MSTLLMIYLPTIIELIIGSLFIKKSISPQSKIFTPRFLCLVAGSLIIGIGKMCIPSPLTMMIFSMIICLISACFYLDTKLKETIPPYILSTIFMMFFVELPTMPLANLFANSQYMVVFHCSLILLWGLLLLYTLPINRFYQSFSNQKPIVYILVINSSLLAIFIMWFFQISKVSFFENILLLFFFSIVIVFINTEVFIISVKNKEKDKRLALLEQYLPVLDEMIQTVRMKQHNYNSKLLALRGLPYTYKSYDDLSEALIEGTYDLNSEIPTYLLNMNLTIVAGYLYKKRVEAVKVGKDIQFQIDKYELPTTIPQYEIIELLDILINNSLESVPTHSTIMLRLSKTDENKILIETKNQGPVASTELNKKMFSYGYSSKRTLERHGRGLGLPYLMEYVDGKDGMVMVTNETIDGVRMLVFTIEV